MDYVPYVILSILALIATSLITYYYARKDTSVVAYAATMIGWFFGFMLIAVLPYDIFLVNLRITLC